MTDAQGQIENRYNTTMGSKPETVTKDTILNLIRRLSSETSGITLEDMRTSFDALTDMIQKIDRNAEPELIGQYDALAKKIGDKYAVQERASA